MSEVKISNFHCSDFGTVVSNKELFDIISKQEIGSGCDFATTMYRKLLLDNPSRKRKVTHNMEYIAGISSREEKLKLYEESIGLLMRDAVSGLFNKSGFSAKDVDFIVVTSSVGKTMPSAASILSSSFEFKPTTITLNLGDMACSSGLAALDTGARLLKSERKSKRCLVVALEAVTNLFNTDSEGAIPNVVFGEGCAALLLTTHHEDALFKIKNSVRTISSSKKDLDVIKYIENDDGPSIKLSRSVPKVAAKAIEKNLRLLVPQILTKKQKLNYALTKKIPEWQKNIDFWALHPGGTAVLNGLSKTLRLSHGDIAFSYRVFQERSNMSSPSIFYVLNEIHNQNVTKDQKILLLTFGSGFKVNSMIIERTTSSVQKLNLILNIKYDGNNFILDTLSSTDSNHELIDSIKLSPIEFSKVDLRNRLWNKDFGYNEIIFSDSLLNFYQPDELLPLAEELYSLLLPKGSVKLPFHSNSFKTQLKDVRNKMKNKFSSAPKSICLS